MIDEEPTTLGRECMFRICYVECEFVYITTNCHCFTLRRKCFVADVVYQLILAAKGKAIIFFCCGLLIFFSLSASMKDQSTYHGISTKLGQ